MWCNNTSVWCNSSLVWCNYAKQWCNPPSTKVPPLAQIVQFHTSVWCNPPLVWCNYTKLWCNRPPPHLHAPKTKKGTENLPAPSQTTSFRTSGLPRLLILEQYSHVHLIFHPSLLNKCQRLDVLL